MRINPVRSISGYLRSNKPYPVVAALACGLYPFVYNYESNFGFVNSWEQFFSYLTVFLIFPLMIFSLASYITRNVERFIKFKNLVLPLLNFCFFTAFMMLNIYGPKKKILVGAVFIAAVLTLILNKHYKKIVILQFLMALIAVISLVTYIPREFGYSHEWTQLPDKIEIAAFEATPNIYVLQPDGYANFSEMSAPPYDIDNSEFEMYLKQSGFKLYDKFRSNYSNTVTSNSSMFAMRHHYYNKVFRDERNPNRYREVIVKDNPVLSVFKNNGYYTSLLLDKDYLLVNRPEISYDYCNIDPSDIPIFSRGFRLSHDLKYELNQLIQSRSDKPLFCFVEKVKPGHIAVRKVNSKGKDAERDVYIDEIKLANEWLRSMIDLIKEKDPQGLIVVVADHGGYVGWNYTGERRKRNDDPLLINSIFSSMLAIRWPDNTAPEFDHLLKSNVNLFRVLITHLSKNKTYLDSMEPNSSFLIINEDAPFGVYEVIDDSGSQVFNGVDH